MPKFTSKQSANCNKQKHINIFYLMKPIIIYTPYPCLVKMGNSSLELDSNEHAVINDEAPIISVYPVGKNDRYSFNIDLNNTMDSKFYTCLEKDNKKLIFLLDGFLSENVKVFTFHHNNIESQIEVSKSFITFHSKDFKKQIALPYKIEKINCGHFQHIDYVSFSANNHQTLIAYNVKNNKAKIFNADEIDISANGFVLHSKYGNYKNVEEIYYVDSQGLKAKEKIFVLLNDNIIEELVPYQFMTAIKNGDIKQANDLLSDELKNNTPIEDVLEYFGKITYFYAISPTTIFAISNGKNVLYDFEMKEKRISDISDNY